MCSLFSFHTDLGKGIGVFLDIVCAKSDLSTNVFIHVAMATQFDIFMANPKMGVNGGIIFTRKEITQTKAIIS
jgi:methylaspartate ammonia-lyase